MKQSHYYFWHWAAFLASLCAAAMVPQEKAGGLDAGTKNGEKKKVVCYYGSWATYRPDVGKFDPEDIDPFMCTHIIYGFVGLGSDNKLRLLDAYNDVCDNWGKCAMKRFTDLKKKNPELKAMVAIGGWNEGSEKYSNMAASASSRKTFIDSVLQFLPTQGFDGLDLDWEYPAHRGGRPDDKENYSLLIAELRSEFDKHGYLLSAAVSAGESTIRAAYDVPSLARYLHFVNVMAYDFHGAWDFHKYTHHNAPLYEHPLDATNGNSPFNIDHSVKVWQELGLPREKLILGLATYGRGFVINQWKADFSSSAQDFLYVAANQGIQAGPYTRERGYQGFNEICDQVKGGGWKVYRDSYIQAPIAVKGTEWIGYDDPQSIAVKSTYARDKNLGGVMVWSLETDDFRGLCSGEKFPLIKTMYRVMNGEIESGGVEAPDDNVITGEESESKPEEQKPPTQQPPTAAPTLPLDPNGLCKHEGNNRHPEDCSLFYHCKHDGDKWDMTEFQCGQGTAYDPEKNVCDFPWNVSGCS